MARMAYEEVILQKGYYQQRLRKGAVLLLFFLLLMGGFILALYFVYISRPQPDYYATTNASQILQLRGMNNPNMSSKALLKPDPPEELTVKGLGEVDK